MAHLTCSLSPWLLMLLCCPLAVLAQEPTTTRVKQPIVLGPDDKPAFPLPPRGFDQERNNIPHGKLEMLEYDSKTVGNKRKLLVYTPPGFSPDKTYNLLYLLHGIGGDEDEWRKYCAPTRSSITSTPTANWRR